MTKKKIQCKRCKKKFLPRAVGQTNEKKFCRVTCRSRFNARMRYEAEKDNPEFKEQKRIYFDKWRKKNREHFNDLMREPNRIKRKRDYDRFDKLGLCTNCGKVRDNPKSKTCKRCYKWKKGKQNGK